jgi:hypothetical protein
LQWLSISTLGIAVTSAGFSTADLIFQAPFSSIVGQSDGTGFLAVFQSARFTCYPATHSVFI